MNIIERAKKNIVPIIFIFLTLIFNIIWVIYTKCAEDDAYITFRFAQQLANGNGFVYNLGERIYGTTTPLLTILLAFWIRFISSDALLGSHLLGILSLFGAQVFTWLTLRELKRPLLDQAFVLGAIAFSSKMLYMSSHGMEMPLLFLFMAISWYLFVKNKFFLGGVFCGLLLFTRMDLFLWPLVLFVFIFLKDRTQAIRFVIGGVLMYAPWLLFATFYFGSPIPYSVTAKYVAYVQYNTQLLSYHLWTVLKYLSPFDMMTQFSFVGPVIYLVPIVWAGWRGKLFEKTKIIVLGVFAIAEIAFLTLTRGTFFTRYFVSVLWVTLILFGLSVGKIWRCIGGKNHLRFVLGIILLSVLSGIFVTGKEYITYNRDRQLNRYEKSLKQIGLWLKENSVPDSSILLEPLGYVGYFSERYMIDEVGLVTPEVVELKRQGIEGKYYIEEFHPDYKIIHCDEADTLLSEADIPLAGEYELLQVYNPLNFINGKDYHEIDPRSLIRNSCYQIWGRKN